MILADHLFAFVLQSQKTYGLSDGELGAVREVLLDANRFVFPKRTTEMAEAAVKAPARLAPLISLPARRTWIEFVDPSEGVLINGTEELTGGAAIYVQKYRERNGAEFIRLVSAAFNLPTGGFMLDDDAESIPARFERRLMGAITLLGAPDLLERRTVKVSRKWNAAREAKGKPTALDHETIDLHLSRYEKDQERAWAEHQKAEGVGFTGRRMRHHFVRAHIRITDRGKVAKVSPHYRGDPSLGDAPRTHIVRP
jgi:hypothetical protein